jgi:regulation of enolase protein 1 (concanavalin A-like superfamily)
MTFEGEYEALYDQAGLMLRLDGETWLKAGIEHSDGVTNFSAVVTRGRSDWSVIEAPLVRGPQRLRLTRQAGAVLIHFAAGEMWRLMRVADFPDGPALLGPMACSPSRGGFRARFLGLSVGPVAADPLHG